VCAAGDAGRWASSISNQGEEMKIKFILPFLLTLLVNGCASIQPSPPPPQMAEVERLKSKFQAYPDFVQIPNNFRVASPHIAALSLSYKSDASPEDVKRFYIEKLGTDGWQLVDDRKLSDWGRDMGGHQLEFRKGEYQIAIEKGGRNNDDWDYGINFSWKKP